MRNAPGGPQGRAEYTSHNQTVPADREPDACTCVGCTSPDPVFDGYVDRGPAALGPRVHRGPVQDESGPLDPLDDLAMRQVEGRP